MENTEGIKLNFGIILATGKYSDFTLECEGYTFKTHKAILCSASPFFKKAIEGHMKENQESRIVLSNDEAPVIARLLIFIYTGEYLNTKLSKWKQEDQTQFGNVKDRYQTIETDWRKRCNLAIAMYQMADKTLIDELRWNSRKRFLAAIRPDQLGADFPIQFWLPEDMSDAITIIKKVYESTRHDDWMLHDPIVHRMLIGIRYHNALTMEPYQKVLEEVPRLAVELATSQLQPTSGQKCKYCARRTRQRLWRCRCGQMQDCDNKDCILLRRTRSICDHCAIFGSCT